MAHTYVLCSIKHLRFYIGCTNDIDARLQRHNGGHVKSTKPYLPWILLWSEEHVTKSESFVRERKLKNLKSRKRVLEYMSRNGRFSEGSSEFLEKIRESTNL